MLVFNNQQRSGYEELVSYGPKFYPSIKEMDAIYRFAGWTVDLMAADLEKLIAYQFIGYMNDEALSRFEAFLGIPVDESKTLEERKTLAYANWSSSGKMSKTKIVSIVNTFAECECTVAFADSVLVINMTFTDDPSLYMDDIRALLRKTIPAHIEILYKGMVDTNITFLWTSKVTVERLINTMTFHLHGNDNSIMLDGSHYLDGSMLLDNMFNLFPFKDLHRLKLTQSETFDMQTGFPMKIENKPATDEIMSLRMDFEATERLSPLLTNKMEVEHIESTGFSLTTMNDLYYLDGSELLNGSRKVDAYIKKEDL